MENKHNYSNVKNILSISGGKDSTAMLLLAIEREVEFEAVFADTGHEHPITYGYLEYLEKRLDIKIRRVKADFTSDMERKKKYIETKWREQGVPEERVLNALSVMYPRGIPYLDLCIMKGRFPDPINQFCTQFLKVRPIETEIYEPVIASGTEIVSWQAVRAQESRRRSGLTDQEEVIGRYTTRSYVVNRPLLRWTWNEVFDMHSRHGVMANPLYKKGMSRVGCNPCIHERKEAIYELSSRWPEMVDKIEEWERIVSMASKQGTATFFSADNRGWGIRQIVEWSHTIHGGKQYDLFKITEDPPTCSSVYGLCE